LHLVGCPYYCTRAYSDYGTETNLRTKSLSAEIRTGDILNMCQTSLTSGLTCSVRRSLAGDLLLMVALHVPLTDEHQEGEVSVNNNLNYDRVKIHRIMWKPTHISSCSKRQHILRWTDSNFV